MKTLVVVLMSIALVGCAAPAEKEAPSRPGAEEVYNRIESLSDCVLLQQEFDTAAANHDREIAELQDGKVSTSYMEAAQARAEEVGCF